MSTREEREDAFRTSQAILALENMVEPKDFAELRQEVIDGKLSFSEAVARLVVESKARSSKASPAQ